MADVYTPDCVPIETTYPATAGSGLGSHATVSVAAFDNVDVPITTANTHPARRAARWVAMC